MGRDLIDDAAGAMDVAGFEAAVEARKRAVDSTAGGGGGKFVICMRDGPSVARRGPNCTASAGMAPLAGRHGECI